MTKAHHAAGELGGDERLVGEAHRLGHVGQYGDGAAVDASRGHVHYGPFPHTLDLHALKKTTTTRALKIT